MRMHADDYADMTQGTHFVCNEWAAKFLEVAKKLTEAQAAITALRWDENCEEFFNQNASLCDLADHITALDDHIADFRNAADLPEEYHVTL